MRSLPPRLLGATVAGTLVSCLAAVVTAAPAPASEVPQPPAGLVVDGKTQPVYGLADAQRVTVNIEVRKDGVPVDSDGDGKTDTVQLRIKRPNTPAGVKVPTIIEASPYNGHTEHRLDWHAKVLPEDGTPTGAAFSRHFADELFTPSSDLDPLAPERVENDTAVPEGPVPPTWDMTYEPYSDNYFVPRGYAVADLDALGTNYSTGCPNPGSRNEQAGVKAAIDWLNGRAVGRDADNQPITAAAWSNGNAALKGQSYDGALAIEGAASGVEGLKTVVSVAGIPDWYRYTRSNGAVVGPDNAAGYDLDNLASSNNSGVNREACKARIKSEISDKLGRSNGNRSAFWDERNYGNVKPNASVFLIQGVEDTTVRPDNATTYWDYLQANNVPSKLWVHQAEHDRPLRLRKDEYVRQMHAWYDYWLWGVANGITNEPKVDVEQSDLATWTTQNTWPSGSSGVKLNFHADGSLSTAVNLSTMTVQSMTDIGGNSSNLDPNGVSTANSLAYTTAPLARDVTLEGTPTFSVQAAVDGVSPYLTAVVVDYGPQQNAKYYLNTKFAPADKLLCAGVNIVGNTGCDGYKEISSGLPSHANYRVLGRSWVDARNMGGTSSIDFPAPTSPATYQWSGQPIQYTVPAGHRIGIVLLSTDTLNTLKYTGTSGTDTTKLTARTEFSSVTFPVKAGSGPVG